MHTKNILLVKHAEENRHYYPSVRQAISSLKVNVLTATVEVADTSKSVEVVMILSTVNPIVAKRELSSLSQIALINPN